MSAHRDAVPLCEQEERALIGALLALFAQRRALRGTALRWEALAALLPEAVRHPPEVLRAYTRQCSEFQLLRGFADHGEAFTQNGLTRLGRFWTKGKWAALYAIAWDPLVNLASLAVAMLLYMGWSWLRGR
ncbi:MAG: hypothetical protein GXX99_08435 [Clostridiales bacterium]|nr:hypothetical protein [Clostridiales bacterium]